MLIADSVLKRTEIRKYLVAILSSNEVVQTADCQTGNLWQNCDGSPAKVFDSPTNELFANAEKSFGLKGAEDVAFAIAVDSEDYTFKGGRINDNSIQFHVDIISHKATGYQRQNILDRVQQRILYRLLSQPTFYDTANGDIKIKPFIGSKQGEMTMRVNDDTEYNGNYTVRQLSFLLTVGECIKVPDCNLQPVCFDFSTPFPCS